MTVVVRDLKAAECTLNEFLEGLKEEFGAREEWKEEGKGMMANGGKASLASVPVGLAVGGGGRGGMHVVGNGGQAGGGNSVL